MCIRDRLMIVVVVIAPDIAPPFVAVDAPWHTNEPPLMIRV